MTTTQIIAREGHFRIILAAIITLLFSALDWAILALIGAAVTLCLVYFYRNPERSAQNIDAGAVTAPIDGVIKRIDKNAHSIQIHIKKPICFSGLLRAPFACEVTNVQHTNGLKNGRSENGEQITLEFISPILKDATCAMQIFPCSQSKLYEAPAFRANARFGFLLSGYVVLELPANATLNVATGERIFGGETLLAVLEIKS